MSALPRLHDVLSSSSDENSPLARALGILFEPSPTLFSDLVPALAAHISSAPPNSISTYMSLIDLSLTIISKWDDDLRAHFIAGHPRIGEVNGLSQLSTKEQAALATSPDVLARLTHLNACYEHRYPGLRFITFVNGRTRAAIKDEMEGVLGLASSLSPDDPPVDNGERRDWWGGVEE
ncbi:hypothetical protein A0H81_06037 [Grifola frondosa]|uniref:Oxo-4-hydroxy-4-carboxy-5-ureidoimidazoline decarboxylase domain-containing protein n=1 Tax=Grifola frondosa TaxID=5627 RepID=A0A1C7MBK8_GRIFR|nr:hypothetical protein A0H81_06037 [Grifola frondosa]